MRLAPILVLAAACKRPERVAHHLPMTGVPVCAVPGYLVRSVFVASSTGDSWGYTGTRSANGLVYLAGVESVHLRFGLCPALARPRGEGCTQVQVAWYTELTVELDPATLQAAGKPGASRQVALPVPPDFDCTTGPATLSSEPI